MEKMAVEKLHQIAEEVVIQRSNDFWDKVNKCVDKIVEDMENHLLIEAQAGRFEYSISITKYASNFNIDSFDYEEFLVEISNKLASYWKSRGFVATVSSNQNDFTIRW